MFKLARIVFAASLFAVAVLAASPLVAFVLSASAVVNVATVFADLMEDESED